MNNTLGDIERFLSFGGYHIPIIIDDKVMVRETERRTWKECLFSCPWKPWIKTKTVLKPDMYFIDVQRPMIWGGMRSERNVVAHPAKVKELKAACESDVG
jgi:hypothetical protein